MIFIKNDHWTGTFGKNSVNKVIWTYEPDDVTREHNFMSSDTDQLGGTWSLETLFNIIHKDGESIVNGIKNNRKSRADVYFYTFDLRENVTPFVQPASDIEKTWNLTHIFNNN
jgi:hypothetical protein